MEEAGAGDGENTVQGGSGAPSGGSSEDGSENESLEDKFERRIKAALANQKTQLRAEFDAQLQAFKAGAASQEKKPDAPKRFTRKELNAAVDAGQITRDQADEVWDGQVRAEAKEEATRTAREVVLGTATQERVDADLSSYKRLKPEIMEEGSETRESIKAAFKRMTSRGSPANEATELAAIEAVLGPLDKLENAAKATRSQESHQESGGGKPAGGGGSGKKLVDHLKGEAKEYYAEQIKKGLHKDWDSVEKELKYASRGVRQRLGLPAT